MRARNMFPKKRSEPDHVVGPTIHGTRIRVSHIVRVDVCILPCVFSIPAYHSNIPQDKKLTLKHKACVF